MDSYFDMHCHLELVADAALAAEEGAAAGIRAFSCSVTPDDYERASELLSEAPNMRVGLGAHPWWIADGRVAGEQLDAFCELAPSCAFIGEIGLDFAGKRDTAANRALQVAALSRMLNACNQGSGGKLLSVHAVKAAGTVLDALEAADTLARHRVIFHWFSGSSDELQRAKAAGCYFSVGPRMLASRRGREYARQIPLDRLLLETDLPAHEGDPLSAEFWQADLNNALTGIAQLKQIDREAVLDTINQTSAQLLKLQTGAL